MKNQELLNQIQDAEDAWIEAKKRFLKSMGWSYTCDTGSLWLWAKEIDGRQVRVSEPAALQLAEMECELGIPVNEL